MTFQETISAYIQERYQITPDFPFKKHPDYGTLKKQLAQAHPDSIDKYMDGKDAFIKKIEKAALKKYWEK